MKFCFHYVVASVKPFPKRYHTWVVRPLWTSRARCETVHVPQRPWSRDSKKIFFCLKCFSIQTMKEKHHLPRGTPNKFASFSLLKLFFRLKFHFFAFNFFWNYYFLFLFSPDDNWHWELSIDNPHFDICKEIALPGSKNFFLFRVGHTQIALKNSKTT